MNNKTSSPVATLGFVYENWREGFLHVLLRVASMIGLPLVIIAVFVLPKAIAIAFVVIYGALVISAFAPLPYALRASFFLAIIYGVGLVTLLGEGINSDASMFFLGLIVIAELLFKLKISILSLAVSVITTMIVGSIMSNGMVSPVNISLPANPWEQWLTYVADLTAIGAATIFAVHTMKTAFGRASQQARDAYEALETERKNLEIHVAERTSGLSKQTEQLRAISYITRQIVTIQELSELLNIAVDLITDQFDYYHTGLFILNESGNQAILQAASSEGGKRMLQKGYRVDILSNDAIAIAALEKRPYIALDVGDDAYIFKYADMPNTRSQIVVPLIVRNAVVGVLDIQSTEPRAFSPTDTDIFISLADHIAISIENARLFNQARTMVAQLESITTTRTEDTWRNKLEQKPHVYTYTPIGVRPEKSSVEDQDALKVPISLRGFEIGSISLTRKPNPLTRDDEEFLKKIASQVSLAADNLHLLEEAQANAQRDQILSTTSSRIRGSLDMDAILKTAVREFQRAMNLKEVEIRLGPSDKANSKEDARKIYTGTLSLKPRKTGNPKADSG